MLQKNTECIGTTLPIASTDRLLRRLVESGVLEENLRLLPGESVGRRMFASSLWSMAPNVRTPG